MKKLINRPNDPGFGRLHEAVTIRGVEIDAKIVGDITALWDVGIVTYMSCEEGRPFNGDLRDLAAWVIVCGGEAEGDTVKDVLEARGHRIVGSYDMTHPNVNGGNPRWGVDYLIGGGIQ